MLLLLNRQSLRQLFRLANQNAFFAPQLTAHYSDITLGYFKQFAEPLDDMVVGFAINRRGGDADFQPLAVETDNFIIGSLGLELAVEQ